MQVRSSRGTSRGTSTPRHASSRRRNFATLAALDVALSIPRRASQSGEIRPSGARIDGSGRSGRAAIEPCRACHQRPGQASVTRGSAPGASRPIARRLRPRAARGAGSCRRWSSAGRCGTRSVLRPLVAGEARFLQCSSTSCSVSCGSFFTTNTFGTSPECSSGTPITAHSSTPGCIATTCSISFGIHVEARHQDHVLLAVDDADEALLVHDADVAGVQEAVRRRAPSRSRRAAASSPPSPAARGCRSRPAAPSGTVRPSSSRSSISVEGIGTPIVPRVLGDVERIGGGRRARSRSGHSPR